MYLLSVEKNLSYDKVSHICRKYSELEGAGSVKVSNIPYKVLPVDKVKYSLAKLVLR